MTGKISIATVVAALATAAGASADCGTYGGRGCAPERARVDLARPSFSHPMRITNSLFPIGSLRSAVLLGRAEGRRFRSETTLLPETRTVTWAGRRIETLLSQYTAYENGRIVEVALDGYAQADDGSVWYLGEDVFEYEHGHVASTEGTWLAGREGPPAMIMPAQPRVGDVFRPENVLGIVFEEVKVVETGRTVAGPHGPVPGAIVTRELHLDGTHERKVFAPGYGEFRTGAGPDLEALAVAVPADSRPGPPPRPLRRLATAAGGMLGSIQVGDWEAAAFTLRRMTSMRRRVMGLGQPPLVARRVRASMRRLGRAVRARREARAAQATIDTSQSVLDLKLRYAAAAEIDRDRFELWCHQVLVHAAAHDRAGVMGDVATLEWIRDRIAHTLTPAGLAEVDDRLAALRIAADGGRLAAAGDHAVRLAGRLRSL